MSSLLFMEEVDRLLDGIANAPTPLINHLLTQGESTLEELESLYDGESKRFVKGWLNRMITYLVAERFWYSSTDEHKYALSQFAKDMIKHIDNFRPFDTTAREEI